jgi:hypothetical protein
MNGRTLSAPPPLPRRDLPVYLADQIRELIESQGLQAGDRGAAGVEARREFGRS